MSGFHDVRLPLAFALGASGGPQWRTDIVQLASGGEFRNAAQIQSRRRWDVGGAVQTFAQLAVLTAFFEARRGRLHGFRFRDATDWKSCAPGQEVSATDQVLGVGDGETATYQLVKHYESGGEVVSRRITHPVAGEVSAALDGELLLSGWSVDALSGLVTFEAPPAPGVEISAGFHFDIPARFDTDQLLTSVDAFNAGRVVSAPIVELLV